MPDFRVVVARSHQFSPFWVPAGLPDLLVTRYEVFRALWTCLVL
jgi:hypothetical protein